MMNNNYEPVRLEDNRLFLLDQLKLPNHLNYLEAATGEDVCDAIKDLAVRGAPAIGVAAGYGMYIAAKNDLNQSGHIGGLEQDGEFLMQSRPTAVNLAYAVKRKLKVYEALRDAGTSEVDNLQKLLEEAIAIHHKELESCRRIAEYGLSLLKPEMGILNHCNAGGLATPGYGTALGPIHLGQERGYDFHVYADETRPLLQGARLTAWELHQSDVDVTVICDNMASLVMKEGRIDAIVAGCDRMAANGDGANKIGTSGVAILAKEYGIPFYMYVPTSTIDLATPPGAEIPIELRRGEEIYEMWYEKPMAPVGVKTYNPSFDVTDHKYITAVITEKGIVRPPYDVNLRKLFEE